MFTGAVPLELVAQIIDAVPFKEWPAVYTCCSGSFRPEMALRQKFPEMRLVGNDISLLSVAIGEYAAGWPIHLQFSGRLAEIEERLEKTDAEARIAAVLVAHEMATYRGANAHAKSVFEHYLRNFPDFLQSARKRLRALLKGLGQYEFFSGDFQAHAAHAIAEGAGILAFAPTYKSGYERLYKFLHDNVDWQQPTYDVWDPANLREWIAGLERENARFCVISDQRFEDIEPRLRYDSASGRRTIFAYVDAGRASIRGKPATETPFEYRPADPNKFRADSVVTIVQADAGHLTFLKNRYLSKGIKHVTGQLNFVVLGLGGRVYLFPQSIRRGKLALLAV